MAHGGDNASEKSVGAGETVYFEKERGVTGVFVARGITHVTVQISGEDLHQQRLDLLQRLADADIPVFLTKLLPHGLSFALRAQRVESGSALVRERIADPVFLNNLALLTVVAGAMRDLSGVMAGIYEVLVAQNIPVRQTGDAYNAVHCLIAGDDAERAAAALRERFGLTPT